MLYPILPCPFTAGLLEALARHYDKVGCEPVLMPHTDEAHEFAYAAVRTDRAVDLIRSPITDSAPTFDAVSMPLDFLSNDPRDGIAPLALVHDAISEGAWG
jgi:hypothetical protein